MLKISPLRFSRNDRNGGGDFSEKVKVNSEEVLLIILQATLLQITNLSSLIHFSLLLITF